MKFGDGIDLQGQQGKHFGDGSAADDAATWGQVQAFIAGLAWKTSVRFASTANVDIASAPASIDTTALTAGDRVLLKNQTAPAENGIRVFTAIGAALARASDMDTAAECKAATVLVTEGTVNHDTAWTQTAEVVTLGTDAITFAQFGGGSTYTAGNGLQLSGGSFSVKLPGSGVVGLVVDGTGVYIDTSVVVRKFSATVGDNSSTDLVVNHNLGTRDVSVTLRLAASAYSALITDWDATDANNVTLHFAVAPTTNQYRVTVLA